MQGELGGGAPVTRPTSSSAKDSAAPTVLIVDDEAAVRNLIAGWLTSGGYDVVAASSADEALILMERVPAGILLCDLVMPGHGGLWLTGRVRQRHPDTAVIMASGGPDLAPVVESLRHGVVDFLTKPFGRERLRDAAARAHAWHTAARQARLWCASLKQQIDDRQAQLLAQCMALQIDADEGLDVLLSTLMAADREAYAHAYRVGTLSLSAARALELTESEAATIERGALLHDIGKLALPDALLKKAPLTPAEQDLIRQHPRLGSALVAQVPSLADAARLVRDAHERPDGLGYPHGSRGDEVGIGARIIGVCEAYDTMTRPWLLRDALSAGEALEELRRNSGTQFHPAVVDVFRRVVFPR